ncbi:hypothetical protein MKW92_032548 [Papaver armeniacum]|nr:hypothetical protein MKW92_032548 [Papaver armeniacum]
MFSRCSLKYWTEDKAAKKERLLKRAKKPIVVKYGLNHITYLIEQNKAQMVIISHDVDPIELVFWLPALCRKMEIPYAIVKGKVSFGAIVHKKTASALCLTSVKNEDNFGSLIGLWVNCIDSIVPAEAVFAQEVKKAKHDQIQSI